MATILNTPLLNAVSAFDPAHPYSFSFLYSGNQAVKSRLLITDNETLAVLLDHIQNGLRLAHDLPAGTLTPGRSYQAQIQVFDANGNSSALSQPVIFYCCSVPEFHFQNIQNSMTISAANLELELIYSQPEAEPLQQYQYYVYELDRSVMYYSEVYYGEENFTHTVYGLKNDTGYYVRAVGRTLHGMELDTGYIQINVQYFTSPANMVLTVMNNRTGGYLSYYTGIKTIGYTVGDENYTIADGAVTLSGNYLIYNEGFNIKEDFTAVIKAGTLPVNRKFFMLRSRDRTHDISLMLTRHNGGLYCRLCAPCSFGDYVLYRDIPKDRYRLQANGDPEFIRTLVILLKRENGLYECTLNYEEE